MKTMSIAVLPFVNMSTDPENEYFSDGMTEEIINALTTIDGLNVTARTSSFAFKNKNMDIREIGKQLGVSTILEGSVRKSNNRIRITAQHIQTEDGFHIWSKNFDRELEDIFALQDEISLLIADQIRENFGHLDVKDQLVSSPKIKLEVYEDFLKGKYLLHTFDKNEILKGISILKEVIEKEPDFALAYSNIHYAYNMLAAAGWLPSNEAFEKGNYYLNKAYELDKNLPECYHSLGWNALNRDWDFINAEKYLSKALELSPGYADAHQKMFITLVLEGKKDMAFKHIQKALELDPLSGLTNYFHGYYYYLEKKYEKANSFYQKCFEISPGFLFPYSMYGLSLIGMDQGDKLKIVAAMVPEIPGGNTERAILTALSQCQLNETEAAEAEIQNLENTLQSEERGRIRFFLIHIYTQQKKYDRALQLIDQGIEEKEPLMTLLREDPLLKPLHSFGRFETSMQKVFKRSASVSENKTENKSQTFNPEELIELNQRLEALLQNEKVFLDPDLSLRLLAEKLKIHPNKLSWLINEHNGKNFNEYINTFRLDAFKKKAIHPENSHLTLLGIAFDSGFNSKTVFNTFFKKATGMSPKEWTNQYR